MAIETPYKNVNEAIKAIVDKYPDNIAINYPFKNVQLTYKELFEKIVKFANALKELGVKKGDRVGIVLANNPEFVISFYALLQIGAVGCSIIKMLKPAEIADIASNAELKGLIIADDGKRTIKKTKKVTPSLDFVIVVGPNEIEGTLKFWEVLEERGSLAPIPEASELELDDWATINFTSGTTGKPKGTIHTHRNYVFAAKAQQLSTKITSDEAIVLCLPMYHIFGLTVMNVILNVGGRLDMLPGFLVQDVLKMLCDSKVTNFAAVPAMYQIMLKQANIQDFVGKFSPNLKSLISGGAPLPLGLVKRMEEVFLDTNGRAIPVTEGFGTTEDSVYGAINPWDGKIKLGTVGLPMPGGKILCVDDDGNPVPPGERGEIVVQNPGVMLGYFKMPLETEKALKPVKGEEGTWYYTGDIGVIDDEGYISIVDRKKDLIIVGGRNVIPRDVEEVLFKHPKIIDATVIGAPHETMGETVRTIVVLKEGEEMTEKEVTDWCAENLADYKVPRIIEFVGLLKKTATGKVLKKDYRASFKEIKGD
ncbi:MAG: AMP-binding protein [Candidatus Helarchaeota archaeon]|nr:AMP-binding protein [Candidatus Helarchaeota archaeon]